MKTLLTKARSGVTLVELLVVILIVTILSVSLLPLLKPYIEQAKYAAEVLPAIANTQTKINLYQYEKDQLPCTYATVNNSTNVKTENGTTGAYDTKESTWRIDTVATKGKLRAYKKAIGTTGTTTVADVGTSDLHVSDFVDVDWQDFLGKRMNPSQFHYHIIKGLGAAKYGYALGVFGDGDGLAKGTGYAVLVLVDTDNKSKVIATWERYKPKSDEVVGFAIKTTGAANNNECCIPGWSWMNASQTSTTWNTLLGMLKGYGWSFNFDDYTGQ